MSIKIHLKALINELDRVHSKDFSWSEYNGMPDFATAENGSQCHFTSNAKKALGLLSDVMHSNRFSTVTKIELDNYIKVVRQVVTNMYSVGKFDSFTANEDKSVIKFLKNEIDTRIELVANTFTHYFPAWTAGMEYKEPFDLGPVRFMSKAQWIDTVEFSERAQKNYLSESEENYRWKKNLTEAINNPKGTTPLNGLANPIYSAIKDCPSLLKVTIKGYEKDYSRKLAKLICKTALDSISAMIGSRDMFLQQALHDERLVPVGSHSIVETDGFLWLPGSSLSGRVPHLSGGDVLEILSEFKHVVVAISSILEGIVFPDNYSYPKLANRWATALDWYGEASRETSDSIALAKLGTSLDVLSAGGKSVGIASMVSNLTGMARDQVVIKGPKERTLDDVIKEIYEDGRSKILHGTYFDRLNPLKKEREQASNIARITLLEAALCLYQYSGEEEDKTFRTITKYKI